MNALAGWYERRVQVDGIRERDVCPGAETAMENAFTRRMVDVDYGVRSTRTNVFTI